MSRTYVLVNGINTDAEAHVTNWTDQAERWIQGRKLGYVYVHSYETPTFARWRKQDKTIFGLRDCLIDAARQGPLDDLILVGHSNGCAVLTELLRRYSHIGCAELHLIAGAVDDDYEKNGLNLAVTRGQVRQITLYCSEQDRALKWARWTRWVPLLGYGSIGLTGPRNMSQEAAARTRQICFGEFDHGTYFNGDHFDHTMCLVTGAQSSAQ